MAPPPVPQVSTRSSAASIDNGTIASRSARAAPAISSADSPLARSPINSAAICTGVASPRITTPKASAASAALNDAPSARRQSAYARTFWALEVAKGTVTGAGSDGGGWSRPKQYPARAAFVNHDKQLRHVLVACSGGRRRLDFWHMLQTFLVTLHFDGSRYVGWQRQPSGRSVQAELERVLERLAGHRIPTHAAGRTDAGVHAVGLGVSLSLPSKWTPDALRRAINALLPHDCWAESVDRMRPGFHARKSAL